MFNFFKIAPLKKYIKYTSEIISWTNNSTYTVLCSQNEVQIYYKDWEYTSLYIENIKFCCVPDNSDYLILLSQHPVDNKIVLKIFYIINKCNRKSIVLSSNTALDINYRVTALSAIKLTDSRLCLSIGLDNGLFLFCINSVSRDIPSNAFMSFSVGSKSIKGINFSKNKRNDVNMFVCSDAGVFCYTISSNLNLSETKVVLDDMASEVHCCTLKLLFGLDVDQYFVVARDDGLYCYTAEGRGPCYAISGYKQTVEWFGKNLIITLKNKEYLDVQETTSNLIIIDILNKIIVLKKEFHEDICVLPVTGQFNCLILLKNGGIFALIEHDMKYKLSHLLKKNLYDIAIRFLEESRANCNTLANVYVHYGDHLLQRGDTLGAIQVYSKTIGIISPFLIIKKIMDFRYNEYLIMYLSQLVKTKFKMPEHVELLNNCFQRTELPETACRIFNMGECNFNNLYFDKESLNHYEKVRQIIEILNNKQNIPAMCFTDFKNAEVLNFFSEHGYYLIKKYPEEMKELVKCLLSERFLHDSIFHKSIISLSLVNKQSAMDFIQSIPTNCEIKTLYNIWIELILQMWQKGNIDLNFVINFIKMHQSEISTDNVFILCRNYNFWPGVRMMFDKCSMEILSTRCLLKNFQMFARYANYSAFEYSTQKLNRVWMQTLKTESLTVNYSIKLITDIVKNITKANPYCILNIVHSFVKRKDFLHSHFNDFLINDNLFNHFKCDKERQVVIFLKDRLVQMENTFNNYLKRPIEFRNRSCDICKQIIKLPSVYFLCQHSYHKQCIRQYSESLLCVVCENAEVSDVKIDKRNSEKLSSFRTVSRNSILLDVAQKIGQCPVDINNDIKTNVHQFSTILNVLHENIENQYDANLNPFND